MMKINNQTNAHQISSYKSRRRPNQDLIMSVNCGFNAKTLEVVSARHGRHLNARARPEYLSSLTSREYKKKQIISNGWLLILLSNR